MTKNYTLNANIKAPYLPITVNTICQVEKNKNDQKMLAEVKYKTTQPTNQGKYHLPDCKNDQKLHDEGLY